PALRRGKPSMLLYQARTAAVAGDRKPSALERSGGSSATNGTATITDRHLPPGQARHHGSWPGCHEMPREQQEAPKKPAGRTPGWRGANMLKNMPTTTK